MAEATPDQTGATRLPPETPSSSQQAIPKRLSSSEQASPKRLSSSEQPMTKQLSPSEEQMAKGLSSSSQPSNAADELPPTAPPMPEELATAVASSAQVPPSNAEPVSTPAESATNRSTPEGDESTSKKTPPADGLRWDYSMPLPNCYLLPSLADLCVPVLAKNFAKYPGFGGLPPKERLRIVNEIPLDLPLTLAADLIPEEAYWKRRVQVRWRNCDIEAHGRSWKQLFFERNLQEALESFHTTEEKESSLVELMKMSAPFVHNLDIVQLPSHLDFLVLFNVLQRELAGLSVNYGGPDARDSVKFDWLKWGMKRSDCFSLAAGLSITATLTTLNLSGNRLDDDKMGILAKGLMANPTVVNLDLSCNFLADEGVRHVANVLKAEASVIGILNLASNHITAEGCRFLAECEDVNRSLVSLNLCFNMLGDLGGKRIIDWLNNNPVIQRVSLETCDIGADSVQSFARLMHNTHSALTALNISGNQAIGKTGGEIVLTGLEAGKQMTELWIVNCNCGKELETKIMNFLVERKYGRVCYHQPWEQAGQPAEEEKAPQPAEAQEQADATAPPEGEKKAGEEKGDEEDDDKDEEEKGEQDKLEGEEAVPKEQGVDTAEEVKPGDQGEHVELLDDILHVGHGHNEACTLECARMVGLPSQHPPPEPVVYPETWFASRDAQAAVQKIEEAKPYWGLESLKDMKEKEKLEPERVT